MTGQVAKDDAGSPTADVDLQSAGSEISGDSSLGDDGPGAGEGPDASPDGGLAGEDDYEGVIETQDVAELDRSAGDLDDDE